MNLRPIHSILLAAAFLGSLLAGCAPPASTPPSNLSLEMRRLQADVMRQEKQLNELTKRLASTEALVAQQRQELTKLTEQTSAPKPTGTSGYYAVPGHQTASTEIQASLSPTEVYLQAFGDYASGRYPEAISGFKTFLQRFPNNSYASNAQFWLGDCYFNQQQHTMALQEFQKVLDDYPRATKKPDALLKIASTQQQLGAAEEARQTIELLKRRYPDSTAAQKADDLNLL